MGHWSDVALVEGVFSGFSIAWCAEPSAVNQNNWSAAMSVCGSKLELPQK
jgi:hypothetical protein